MTFEDSRRDFIESQFSQEEIADLKERGLYQDYVEGTISVNTIYTLLREQAI
jgi:hypothetical protein